MYNYSKIIDLTIILKMILARMFFYASTIRWCYCSHGNFSIQTLWRHGTLVPYNKKCFSSKRKQNVWSFKCIGLWFNIEQESGWGMSPSTVCWQVFFLLKISFTSYFYDVRDVQKHVSIGKKKGVVDKLL